ncbi:L-lactate permease [Desulfurobacterium sp.]
MDFFFAVSPILLVLIGMLLFSRSGVFMSIAGWIFAGLVAWLYFKTPISVVIGASIYGIVKAFAITFAVAFTMLMIFIMKETGALSEIVKTVRSITTNKVEQTLFIGMGFGSLATSLGVVTPALFPPVFVALGFTPLAAVAISILCYDPLTSFALLSIPITLPARVVWGPFNIKPPGIANLEQFIWIFTQKITIFLPVVSVCFALMMLYFVGRWEAVKKNFIPAVVSGLVLSLSALTMAYTKIVPVEVIGVLSGLVTMVVIYFMFRKSKKTEVKIDAAFLKAISPWLLLFTFSLITNYPPVKKFLEDLPGKVEILPMLGGKTIDLNIFAHVYFWILMATLLSLPLLNPTKEQLSSALKTWKQRVSGPFIAYSLFFAVAFIMAWSGMEIVNGKLTPGAAFKTMNMDIIIGTTLAHLFGKLYPLVSPFLGLLGAFVGGSETASNVLFAKIQYSAIVATAGAAAFMPAYGAHAVGGGIASAITPSKITNAAALVGLKGKDESSLMKTMIIPVLIMTLFVGIMLQIIVSTM